MFKHAAFIALAYLAVTAAQAAPIVEYFDYGGTGQSALQGKGTAGDGWAGAWGANSSGSDPQYYPSINLTYSDPNYSSDNLATTGAIGGNQAGFYARRSFTTAFADTTVWVSALAYNANASGLIFLCFDQGSAITAKNVVGIRNNKPVMRYNSTSDSYSTRTLSTTTYLLLAKIVVSSTGNDSIDFWVNPNLSGGEAGLGTPDRVGTGQDPFSSNLSIVGVSAQTTNRLDALRIGSSLEEVTVPEPATLILVCMGGVLVLRRR